VHAELSAAPNFLRRLTRDIEAASKLEHRRIGRVLEQGSDPVHGAFVCSELLPGRALTSAAGLGSGAEPGTSRADELTPHRICELLMQVLSALSDAHRHGVLHRNLKPSNVLVSRDESGHEQVKVCDFGNPQRARIGAEYMAPEQADGGAIDGEADVYAAGIMLYELLTGDVPFRGTTPADTLALHKDQPLLPPRQKRPDRALPRELEAVCIKALAKKPSERHRSPREMSQALRAVVALLGQRADEPLGSAVFAESHSALADSVTADRVTMPGEQLRSRTKFWLGAGLLAAVCAAVIMNPEIEPNQDPTVTGATADATRVHGQVALEQGIALLLQGESATAIPNLRNARRALGEVPEVLRPLGEALVLENQLDEGTLLLERYLELEPDARDAPYVRSLLRRKQEQ
jgi:serine/threonine protein kinase